ncbi:MAG: hypothetical protein QOG31_1482, partial [Thermoplasmata archaeon]|nr:hypothetical protein [Thermoplasmata archaeon]
LAHWSPAGFPDGQGGTWTWAEPGAQVAVRDGWLEVAVPRFTRSHAQVQIFDNPKHLLACAAPIPVPDAGVVVEVEMAAALHDGDPSDWGNGFASFNLMDFEHGLVLDGLANGARTGILFERLHIPGMVPFEQSFTSIADGPASKPGQVHAYRFEVDPLARRVQGFVDGRPVLDWRNVPARINSFTPGFGLITLQPIKDGRSTSLKGQGASGRLGAIRTSPLRG